MLLNYFLFFLFCIVYASVQNVLGIVTQLPLVKNDWLPISLYTLSNIGLIILFYCLINLNVLIVALIYVIVEAVFYKITSKNKLKIFNYFLKSNAILK